MALVAVSDHASFVQPGPAQHVPDLIGCETAVLQVPPALGGGHEITGRMRAELAAIGVRGERPPVVLRIRKCLRDVFRAGPALLQLLRNALRPETAGRTRAHVGLCVARIALQPRGREVVEDPGDVGRGMAPRGELALKFRPGVLATRQRREGLRTQSCAGVAVIAQASASSSLSASAPSVCGSVVSRMRASISCAISGCSLR